MKKIGIILILLGIIVVGWLVFGSSDKGDIYEEPSTSLTFIESPLALTHTYKAGVHALAGRISLPTPCHELSTDTVVFESFPEQAVLQFTITEPKESCIQVINEEEVSFEIAASEAATFRALVNGQSYDIQLIESSRVSNE